MLTMVKTVTRTTSKGKAKGITKKRRSNSSGGLKSYSTATRFLATFTDYERLCRIGYNNINFSLSRMQKLLSLVGNPHRKFKSVHIAGTKGKGSTAHMVANMLEGSEYKVGLYTSPHVVDVRERIMINNRMIPEHDFVRLLNKLLPTLRDSDEKHRSTLFEILTCLGFMYFAEEEVDMAVIETGLGGRLDSTNVIKPEISAITTISYDHMHILGNTLPKIATEKAGIFKPGVPAISVPQPPEVKEALTKVARAVKTPLRFTGEDIDFSYRFESSRITGPHTRICLTTPRSKFEHLPVPLPGEHQAINCGLALAIIDALKEKGYQINDQQALEGLARTRLPARMELVSEDPRILIDGAHNPPSIEALIKTIGQHITYDSMVVIFGCAVDKDVDGMLDQIAMGADKVIFTKNGTMRSADPEELALRFEERTGRMAQWADNVGEALRVAGSVATRGDIICVTGSFYLAGEAKRIFITRNGQGNRN
jgi:dihydrofolate synthase / folylpolyglutamate synthase